MKAGVPLLLTAVLLSWTSWADGQQAMRSKEVDTRVLFELQEGKPAGTVVGTIPTRANFTYRFNDNPREFALNGTTGTITTTVEIDRESLSSDRFDLVVLSSQPTYPIEVRVTILDVNDNAPVFPEASIAVSFSESANVGTRVILDTATDGDAGVNDITTDYKIVSGNEDRKFRLVVTTNPSGETPYLHIETTERLDRESKDSYTLNISAQDGGEIPKMGFLQVNVTVLDVNDNPPIFDHSDYFVSINESLPAGTSVLQVRATDSDIGDNARITYFLSDAETEFAIDPQQGVITTSDTLSCRKNNPTPQESPGKGPKSCVFTVFARDHGSPQQNGRAYVTVNLLDANDHDPVIRFRVFTTPDSYATVDENAQNGSVVAAVSVIDYDEGPNGETFVEIRGGNEQNHFRLESTPSFDIVRVNGVLDREQVSRYNLTITATDRGSPPRSSTAFLIIHVNDVNDHEPVFEKTEYSALLSELAPVGTFVASIRATDEDTGVNAHIFYAIASGNDKKWFKIDANTGLVTTVRPLDREEQDFVELKISAKDGGPNPRWAYSFLKIQILDDNDEAPSFSQSTLNVSLSENAQPKSLVTVVSASDNDLGMNGSVVYALDPEVEHIYPNMFDLDSVHGRLMTKVELDREERGSYTIKVVARDQGQPTLSSTVTIQLTILDVNDHKPELYPKQYFVHLEDGSPPASYVATVTATDKDEGRNAAISYNIVSGSEGKFEINETTGVLLTSANLILAHQARYEIVVSATNPGDKESLNQQTALVVVFVRDPTKVIPLQFVQRDGYQFVTDENASVGREIGRAALVRSGHVDRARFSIIGGDPLGWFRIDPLTGVVVTTAPIDREKRDRLTLDVVANTLAYFVRTSVTVTVTDLNDNAPEFKTPFQRISLPEGWPIGLELYAAEATDKDDGINSRIEYRLVSNPEEIFAVDKDTGMLKLQKPVRSQAGREFELEITATDLGSPPLSSRQQIVVIVEDENDHTPMFDRVSYETSILELTPVNDRFFSLLASDSDSGENGRVLYDIVEGNDDGKFGIFPDGTMYVRNPLDRESRDFYSLTVTARDNGTKPRSSAVSVVVHVVDENDNSPRFDNATFTFYIAENEPPDSYVGKLSAEDNDRGRNAELTYSISSNQNDFAVDPKTGFLRTLHFFDREKLVEVSGHDYVVLEAVVLDGGITRLRGEAKVIVHVTDVNDSAPKFLRASYKTTVSEAAPQRTHVVRISATDADDGPNGNVIYAIVAGNVDDSFVIDESTGQISLLKSLDREKTSSYELTVLARDTGVDVKHTSTATVNIQVLDENDNAPEFLVRLQKVEIPETTQVGYEIHRFVATDRDLGLNGEVSFAIASGNIKETFKIDSVSGVLFLDRPLDYEQQSSYLLNITASDGGSPRQLRTLPFVIKVLDVNDNPPQFANVAIVRQVEEGIPMNTPVVTVTAVDKDSKLNGKVVYTITNQEPPGSHFAVRPETGVIYTAANIDREFSDTFRLTVTATDQGFPKLSSEKTVTIIVEDINDNAPEFVSVDAGVLPEDSEKGYIVMSLSAADADANTNGLVTYDLLEGDTSLFSLDRNTGDLYLSRQVGRPAVTYSLTVQAIDEAVLSHRKSSRTVLTVLGSSKRTQGVPVFSASEYSGAVYENEPASTSVLTVRAQSDAEAQLEYYLTAVRADGAAVGQRFAIHRETGVVSTAAVLDREIDSDVYELEVHVIDTKATSPRTAKTKVTVTVLDRNDSPPRFLNTPFLISMSEDTPTGATVTTIRAEDPDLEGGVKFSLAAEESRFQIDPQRGVIVLMEPLDRETKAQHKFTVTATDGIQAAEAPITIDVIDTNDNLPVFSEQVYSFDLWEDTQRGAQVGVVSAKDADLGLNRQVSYSVLSDWANDVFSLNPQTGVFTLTSHLDYEQYQHYVFVVQAQDSGTPSLSSTVTVYINVLDLNDNAPLFDPMSYSDEVFENVTIGSSIVRVSATDLDSGDNGRIIYKIVEGDADQQFAISANGTIFTTKSLDRETKSFYSLVVSATDQAAIVDQRLSSTVQVTIILKDVNDMSPEFVTPNVTSVQENVPMNTIVMAVKAVDRDEGRNSYIEYSLAPKADNKFVLGPVDGLLRVKGILDREVKSGYEVRVIAKDRGYPTRSASVDIVVNVLDENDNSPVFDPRQYSASVSENASIGLSVLQISATDQDEGSSGQVRYSIIAGDPNHDFVIGEDTGIVRVRKNLDYERKNRYVVTVQAEDSGNDVRYDTATVTITLTDVNDNAPVFLDSPYEVNVVENSDRVPAAIVTMSAYDADLLPRGNLHYLIKDGDKSAFRINATSGQLSVIKALDREKQSEYVLTILAMDSGTPRQTGSGTVSVTVSDVNDNSPRFDRARYVTSVPENQPPNYPVVQIAATDADTGNNGLVKYSMKGDHEGRFAVDSWTGAIVSKTVLDREERARYDVILVAEDCGLTTRHSTSAEVTIIVEDQNDNEPRFAGQNYTVIVPDGAQGGHFVFGAHAHDPDVGINSQVVYHLSGSDADKFQINQDTGVIRLVHKLAKRAGYHLEVHAMDNGRVPLSSSAHLEVLTAPSHLFPQYKPGSRSFTVEEDTTNDGRVFATVLAVSPKPGSAGRISYHIAGGNVGGVFTVDSATGKVTVAADNEGLDFETSPRFELWIEARDSDDPPYSSVLKLNVEVTDANDNAPVFEYDIYNASIREEQYPPQMVITVKAADADSGPNSEMTYQFKASTPTDIPFSLDSKTGEIRTTAKLDREEVDEYRLVVEAVDHGSPAKTGTTTIFVSVADKNDNPPRFTRLFSVNVTENAPLGSFVIQVTSSDRDADVNANATYSFTENPGEKFEIDPLSGNVTVVGLIDRETRDEYLLKVAAVDGSWKAETPLTISVQDVNDNPPSFTMSKYVFSIPELRQPVSFVGRVSATDMDKQGPNSMVSFTLKRPSDFFRIDPGTGEILTKQVLHYKRSPRGDSSPENQHALKIIAMDHGKPPLSSEVTVHVNIVDSNNNAPVFTKVAYFSPLPDNSGVGLSVVQVHAQDTLDAGVNAEVRYSVTAGNGSDTFAVHTTSGWVTVSKPFHGQIGQIYTIKVRATDMGVPSKYAETTVTVTVTADNKYSPVFTALSYQIIIPENEPVQSEILTVTATDADSGLNGEVTYGIADGNINNSFSIDSDNGAITIINPLDFETTNQYRVNITACDRAFHPKCASAKLIVIITDVNDCAPVFNATSFEAYIPENESPGTYITQLVATDADSPRNRLIQYSLVGPSSRDFTIDSQTGVVRSKNAFDYEHRNYYSLEVVVSNPGSLQYSSAKLNVHITGKNEFYPKFVQPVFQFTVSESTALGTPIGQVMAADEDSGPEGDVYFLFVGSSNDKGFRIQPNTGIITVARHLDRESQARVVLAVMAKNSGSIRGNDTDEAQVVIGIQDGNDPPVFLDQVYEAHVSEAAPVGSSIIVVSAVDKDVRPNNNQFSYSIIDGNIGKVFTIDSQTGLVHTAGELDREQISGYNLTIGAIDNGSPPQTGTAMLRVFIDDVNDNGPIFDPPEVVGYVSENEPPYTSVMVLSAQDRDLPPNGGPFTYYLVGGHRNEFQVDKQTGLLRTTRSLDREATPTLDVIVEVQDGGVPAMKARHTVTVVVKDKNDSPSSPRSLTVLVWVYEHVFSGGKIADVRPLDPDTTGEYQCHLEAGDSSVFSIIRNCDLHASRLQNPRNYSLTMRGNDGYHQDVMSNIMIEFRAFDNTTVENSVTLRIVNQTASDFLTSHYDHFLKVLAKVLKTIGEPVIYSITDMNGQVQLTLTVRKPGGYATPTEVTAWLNKKKDILQGMLSKEVLIGYDPCTSEPCKNGGKCGSFLDLQDSLSILDSPFLVFTSPTVIRSFSCECPDGFSGVHCQDQRDPCSPNPCAGSGTCQLDGNGFQCHCPSHLQGERCEAPRADTCASSPCKNGGSCKDAPTGSFFCLCRPGFKGSLCEQTTDSCRPNRCLNGGTCVNEKPGYHCVCEPNYFGRHCEKSTYGFHPYSYMAFPSLRPTTNDISVIFSTNRKNALLVYNFGMHNGGRSDFVALEIIEGKPQFSFGGSRTAISKVSLNTDVADGGWHKVTVIRNGRVASLSAVGCQNHGEYCEECSHANLNCSVSVTGQTGTLSFSNNHLYIGGVPSIDPLLERPSQVAFDDFVGCVHSVAVNGQLLDLDAPLQSQHTTSNCGRKGDLCSTPSSKACGESGTCHDLWFSATCMCAGGAVAEECNEAVEPYSLASGSYLELVPREKHRRGALYQGTAARQRLKRSIEEDAIPPRKSFSVRVRTKVENGLLMYAATEYDYTSLQLTEGYITYTSQMKNHDPVTLVSRKVSDGRWHTITLWKNLDNNNLITLSVDDLSEEIRAEKAVHDFLDPFLTSLAIGGHWEQNSVAHDSVRDFQGCLQQVIINGEIQSPNASHGFFKVIPHGVVLRSCSEEAMGLDVAPTDPLSVGIILVIVFFVILIVVILVSFVVFRRCKLRRDKSAPSHKQNGNAFLTNLGPESGNTRAGLHQDANSNFADNPNVNTTGNIHEDILRSHHLGQDLVPKKMKDRSDVMREERPQQRPDIIEREVMNTSPAVIPPRVEDHPPAIEKPPYNPVPSCPPQEPEMPEHYDLENASSIAPSDIDIVYHYKVFRDGNTHNLRKFKANPHMPNHHKHHHRHSPHQFQPSPIRESPRNVLRQSPSHVVPRESPSALKMQNTPLARLSPSSELSRQTPRILTLQDISGKPLQTALLATSHTGVGSKDYKDPLTNSERSLNSPVSHLSRSTSSMQSGPPQATKLKKKKPGELSLGLTAEEIDRLNARPRNSSLVSTLDAVSSSSEDNTEKNKLSNLLESNTQIMDAHESSTDESGNDSFTCSEFEYDNNYDKGHRDFGPGNMIFSKLAEEVNENDEDSSKTYDGFDSFRGSLSTLVASDDDISHLPYKPPNGANMLGWDCLLNWGPNFENLVGVFKDIAELPDTVNPLTPSHSKPSEEYV
ncbi:cadherin-related tumor suppressor-like [Ornithodoros turicata]|uniref:cadherin-related tumor suppressor-like n=1 Tax=Ornithodoros turicata TaxID=34597 RepID=UPI003138E8F9